MLLDWIIQWSIVDCIVLVGVFRLISCCSLLWCEEGHASNSEGWDNMLFSSGVLYEFLPSDKESVSMVLLLFDMSQPVMHRQVSAGSLA